MTERPLLYSFRRCPYAMRARMAILASGIEVELREIVLRDKPEAMLAVSPKGTVPVLVLPTGAVLDESLDIMRWALGQADPLGWLKGDDVNLIRANDGPFKSALDRYKYPHRYGLESGTVFRDEARPFLDELDTRLADSTYFNGAIPRLCDIALFPFVRQFRATDPNWFDAQDFKAVQAWLTALIGSVYFEAIMNRYPPWRLGDLPTLFP
jgi:glutathione S-transferase